MRRTLWAVCVLPGLLGCGGDGTEQQPSAGGGGAGMSPSPPAPSEGGTMGAAPPAAGAGGGAVVPPPPPPPLPKPTLVTIEIDGAIIAPGKADGTQWDGLGGSVDAAIIRDVTTALAASDPVTALASVLAEPAAQALEKPDPFGFARLTATGFAQEAQVLLAMDPPASLNTFTPQWPDPPTIRHVPVDADMRLRVQLWDSDVVDNDDIGVVELNGDDVRAALAARKVVGIKTADQLPGRILVVTVSVRAE